MGKYFKKKPPRSRGPWIIVLAVAAVALLLALVIRPPVWTPGQEPSTGEPSAGDITENTTGETETRPVKIEIAEKTDINLGYGMYIRDVAKYAGIYMEDGTDEIVSDVLMIVVENTGDRDIQYAEIEMPVGGETAYFKLSTLPAGEPIVLLEQNRMKYGKLDYSTAVASNVIVFEEPLRICQDALEIQILNGAMNITNISGGDIAADIVVYYKNSAPDMLYGGITYRITISGGLKAGELKQITGGHISQNGSRIMWVTVG